MVWRRLPTYFPNITLHMMKLSPENLQTLQQTGYLREVAFRTTPNVTKVLVMPRGHCQPAQRVVFMRAQSAWVTCLCLDLLLAPVLILRASTGA